VSRRVPEGVEEGKQEERKEGKREGEKSEREAQSFGQCHTMVKDVTQIDTSIKVRQRSATTIRGLVHDNA
jgi:flagellar biosynthesis/type III secretory pathway protein FliH